MQMKNEIKMRLLAAVCLCWAILAASSCSEIFSPDISNHTLVINSPQDSLYQSSPNVAFWWEDDEDVSAYQFRLVQLFGGNQNLIMDSLLPGNSFSLSLEPNFAYQWQVRGQNEGSNTAWVGGVFWIDDTAPDKATALRMNGDTLASGQGDSLVWLSSDFPLDQIRYPVRDSLLIYRRNDSLNLGAAYLFDVQDPRVLPLTASSPSPFNGAGNYYWRVVTIDQAGNRQGSDLFSFVIQ
jgi:hypothetical protein